ncbi:hypothetical protein ACGF3C_19605 [Micromonospora sp. NPDC047762]|uniref:hypothetical protein n=1 Tax=Micromonospora sp. NPDC047762 TaxID=3364255 RepID=UPI003714FA91
MSYKNEDEVKKALNIDTWRNLSKEKVSQFAAMMPDIDKDVALKIIDQLPEFGRLITGAIDAMEKEHESTLASNQQSQESAHRAWREIREIYRSELAHEGLSPEYKMFILEKISETGDKESEKDTENKQFLAGLSNSFKVGALAALGTAIVVVGGRVVHQFGKKL